MAKPGKNYDVIIIGGGPSGLTMACLLGMRDLDVLCIDREDPKITLDKNFDGRTIAISYGSQQVMEKAGVWQNMSKNGCPIEHIKILDGKSPVLLDFLSKEVEDRAFGTIVEMRHIREALAKKIAALKNVTYLAPASVEKIHTDKKEASVTCADGKTYTAKLLIGADGRGSPLRKHLGISTHGWTYDQTALVAIVEHKKPHHNVAVEHFRKEGPFAILPMQNDAKGKHRSSLVWTMQAREAETFINCDDDVFNTALAARFPAEYGAVKLASKRFSYPLSLIHAHQYTGTRVALVADAAHGMHPIAGQGLNMGMRDLDALTDILSDAKKSKRDIGSAEILGQYESARRFDNMTMMAATDLLNKLFSNELPFIGSLRRLGVSLVGRSPTAKRFFMHQAMGLKAGSRK